MILSVTTPPVLVPVPYEFPYKYNSLQLTFCCADHYGFSTNWYVIKTFLLSIYLEFELMAFHTLALCSYLNLFTFILIIIIQNYYYTVYKYRETIQLTTWEY